MESILNSIKQLLGIDENENHFDTDIMIHINSVFSNLYQMGVGPDEPFQIGDTSAVWSDFTDNDAVFSNVKTYMYLKVKQVFDPPSNSSILTAFDNQIKELEWRLTVGASNKAMEENENV